MNVRKAVITAASPDQHTLPLQRLVDRDGVEKSALQMIVDEVVEAGIEEIAVVIQPGDATEYRRAAGSHVGMLRFIEQTDPVGYADAVARAADFVADEPFLHLVGDHMYLSCNDIRCARQVIDVATEFDCSVSAVQATREHKLPFYGVAGGTRVPRKSRLYEISRVIEKPTPTQAEQELVVAGLRQGTYLGFFGIHVLTPDIIEPLQRTIRERGKDERPSLTSALAVLAKRQKYLALEVEGLRYNIGAKYGLLITQMAFALSGRDRDLVLSELVELLAIRTMEGGCEGRS
ncbi:MAG: hypothetical protein KDA83_20500 [Planctomycetales bacterium]|nr:hypothetical protein [Planctomycetales bacterium]